MASKTKHQLTQGFTLIELLVTISIISILAAVVMVSVTTARAKAKDSKVRSEIRSIKLALESYAVEHGGYPNPGANTTWCIGANDCLLAGETITNNTNNWSIAMLLPEIKSNDLFASAMDALFPNYVSNVDYLDDQGNHNKGYIYVSCNLDKNTYPVCPIDPTSDEDKSYLIYTTSNSVKSMEVGQFIELTCDTDTCNPSTPRAATCGPANNEDCDNYSSNLIACNYDADGSGIKNGNCNCGNGAENCNNFCYKYTSCNYDVNGEGSCDYSCGTFVCSGNMMAYCNQNYGEIYCNNFVGCEWDSNSNNCNRNSINCSDLSPDTCNIPIAGCTLSRY